MTIHPLRPVQIALKTRGRKPQTVKVPQLGTLVDERTVDTSAFKGYPFMDLVNFYQSQGIDPSQALVEGGNKLLRERARDSAPSLTRLLMASGVVTDPKEARLLDMHLKKTAKFLKVSPETILGRALGELSETTAEEGPEEGPSRSRPARPTRAARPV